MASALPGRADDLYTVGNIHVDASGISTSAARSAALAQGRPKAWTVLYRRLTHQQDWGKQPQLDDASLERLIRTFTVANERRSTTRYVADVSYSFSPESVARVLSGSGVAFAQSQAKRLLLVPMAPGYSRGSPWTAAFAAPRFAQSAVPFSLPGNENLEGMTLDTANWQQIEPIATRLHAGEAVLVLATPNGKTLTLTLKRMGPGALPAKSSVEVPMLPGGAPATYAAAADAALHAIEEMWKSQSALNISQQGHLAADVRIESLAQWGALQAQMAAVPNVAGISVTAMDIGLVRINVTYLGTIDQLKDALAAQGVALASRGGVWSIASAAPAPAP
ncbi:MAG: hypothetical protein JO261_04245 [Alphaproteobacteria bacterium]|nr:hypothetical protein [Alphaproteobacteria bacterium]MBV9692891.1 hypothetical protein [Alphaproteobacteria bacterium]